MKTLIEGKTGLNEAIGDHELCAWQPARGVVWVQTRNPKHARRMNEALIQGVETARAVLTTTPQGQAADAQFVKWLMDHQKEAGVFTTVSGLVEQLTDNPAARLTAQEIASRVNIAAAKVPANAG